MSFVSEVSPQLWKQLNDDAAPNRPSVGKLVKVVEGKYAGIRGKVFWHGLDRYGNQYATDAQLALREVIGRHGCRVGILTNDGNRVFVPADYTEVIQYG